MSDTTSIRRLLHSRPWWFWVYAIAGALVLLLVMFVVADRATQPTGGFEPVASTVVPENEFLPTDRPISDCISAVPKPGCGSEARGGWRQGVVLLAILVGLGVIAWRIVAASRRARWAPPTVTGPRTPDPTTARSERDGDRAP